MAMKPSKNTPEPKAATAVFDPVGMVTVHVVTPNDNEYDVKPREPFKIKAEDVAWFFGDWNWAFRQHLCLVKDYHPTCGYHDPKPGAIRVLPVVKVVRPVDPKSDTVPPAAKEEEKAPEPPFAEPDEGTVPEKE